MPLSHRKNISTPSLVIEEYSGQNYGGYYIPQLKHIAVVWNPDWGEKDFISTLAHEFRQHIQTELGMFGRKYISSTLREDLEYEKQINWYFNTFPWEMDALEYQNKFAKCDVSDWWLRKLV